MTDGTNPWGDRTPLNGEVDFTMMYAAHDAFSRDMHRLTIASQAGHAFTPESQAGWAMFTKQLHIHHTSEDTALWPRLRAAVSVPSEVAVLDAMEMEHAQLDPQLEHIGAAMADHNAASLADSVHTLGAGLTAHMRHEENEALPLIEKYLGPAGWAAFGQDIRKKQGGLRAGAEYLPWLLDDAPDSTQTRVLRLLPPPVRLLYRRIWAPRYRRAALPQPTTSQPPARRTW